MKDLEDQLDDALRRGFSEDRRAELLKGKTMQTDQVKTNGTNGHAVVRPEIVYLDVENIDANPHNARKRFDRIEELAASMTTHGQLEPTLVRPKGKRYELVYGERRYRAAKLAKLPLMTTVRDLDDKAADEIMLVENGQREDLHELEEAEGYERLRKDHGYTVEEIAVKVNKTVATVYARMKLCALCKKAREAFREGVIDGTKALLLARIPHEDMQLEALKEVSGERKVWADESTYRSGDHQISVPVSTREAFHIIQSRFMLRLVDAPFDRVSVTLVAKAGSCTACPKRSGNQGELFADVKSKDICTDPKCYREKLDAHWATIKIAAKDTGNKVVSEKGELFDSAGTLSYGSGYEDLASKKWDYQAGKERPIRDLVGKAEIFYARDKQGGIHELVKKAAVTAAERKVSPAEKKRLEADKAAARKEDAKTAIREKCDELAIAALVEKAEGKQPNADFYRAILVAWVRDVSYGDDSIENVLRRRGLLKEDQELEDLADEGKHIQRIVAKLSEKTCRSLLVELVAVDAANSGAHARGERTEYDMLCDFYKVDPKKFAAEAKASVGAGAKS